MSEEKNLNQIYIGLNQGIDSMFPHILMEIVDLETHIIAGRRDNALKAIGWLKNDLADLEGYVHEYRKVTDDNFASTNSPKLQLKPTAQTKFFSRKTD